MYTVYCLRLHLSRKLSDTLGITPAFIGEVAFRLLRALFYSVTSSLWVSLGFTLIPGPMVVAIVMRLT